MSSAVHWALIWVASAFVIGRIFAVALCRAAAKPTPYDREDSKRLAAERRRLGEERRFNSRSGRWS